MIQGPLVLGHRQDPEADRQVLSGEDRFDSRNSAGGAGVHAHDSRVGMRAAEDPAVERAR